MIEDALQLVTYERDLLRLVYEQARAFLRNNGVDAFRAALAVDRMDDACEQVKLFDSGLGDFDLPALATGYEIVPIIATPAILKSLRTGSLRDVPTDEVCRVRWAAVLCAARLSSERR